MNTNFKVIGLTRLGIEPQVYQSRSRCSVPLGRLIGCGLILMMTLLTLMVSLVVANQNKSVISNFCSLVNWSCADIFYISLLKPNQQALKRKDSIVHCDSIGRRNNGIIGSNNCQCLVNLALKCHSLMAVEFGAGQIG